MKQKQQVKTNYNIPTPFSTPNVCFVIISKYVSNWTLGNVWVNILDGIGVATGSRGDMAPEILTYVVIVCFDRRYPKHSVIHLKSNILATPKSWAGYATAWP